MKGRKETSRICHRLLSGIHPPHGLGIVEPTVALVRARLAPDEAHAIEDPAKEYGSRYEGEHGAEHHAESHGGSFVLLWYATHGDEEIRSSARGANELEEAHDRKKAYKLGPTVDWTCARSGLT